MSGMIARESERVVRGDKRGVSATLFSFGGILLMELQSEYCERARLALYERISQWQTMEEIADSGTRSAGESSSLRVPL